MRCFQCHGAFAANEVLESFPHGESIAFDPGRGRLWLICSGCARWTLVPIESRWEALEELEKQVRDGARLLAQTDNIALLQARSLRIVRVGRANRQEEAWWRYGRELATRYTRFKQIEKRGAMLDTGARAVGRLITFAIIGIPWLPGGDPGLEERWVERARRKQFGSHAWRGEARCTCGAELHELHWDDRGSWRIEIAAGGSDPRLIIPCANCHRRITRGSLVLEGMQATHVTRRVLAFQNFAGATEKQIGYATKLLEDAGGPQRVLTALGREHTRIGRLVSTQRFALEIALHEENERQIAEMELAELEARWREEEAIASIIDGELTPVPFLSRLIARERQP